jgi:hypothetical protein
MFKYAYPGESADKIELHPEAMVDAVISRGN